MNYEIKSAEDANRDEIFFDKNTKLLSFKNLNGIIIPLANNATLANLEAQVTDIVTDGLPVVADGTTITGTGTLASPLSAKDSRPYKVFTGIIKQTGTGNPTFPIIYENNLGVTPAFFRFGQTGQYEFSNSVLVIGKTYMHVIPGMATSGNNIVPSEVRCITGNTWNGLGNTCIIKTSNSTGVQADSILDYYFIEIRVYN